MSVLFQHFNDRPNFKMKFPVSPGLLICAGQDRRSIQNADWKSIRPLLSFFDFRRGILCLPELHSQLFSWHQNIVIHILSHHQFTVCHEIADNISSRFWKLSVALSVLRQYPDNSAEIAAGFIFHKAAKHTFQLGKIYRNGWWQKLHLWIVQLYAGFSSPAKHRDLLKSKVLYTLRQKLFFRISKHLAKELLTERILPDNWK